MKKSKDIAEIVGIIMGDGGIYLDSKGKYQTHIAFHKHEFQYLEYVKNKIESYFSYKFCVTELKNEYLFRYKKIRKL